MLRGERMEKRPPGAPRTVGAPVQQCAPLCWWIRSWMQGPKSHNDEQMDGFTLSLSLSQQAQQARALSHQQAKGSNQERSASCSSTIASPCTRSMLERRRLTGCLEAKVHCSSSTLSP